MIIRLILPTAVLLIGLASCQTAPVYDTPEKVLAASTVEHDQYEGTTWVKAPFVGYGDGFSQCFLRTLVTDGGARTNQLYVMYKPRDWAFLNRASDSRGQTLKVLVVDRDVSRYASLTEHVAVQLPDAYLQDAASTGLDIQIIGKSGRTVVRLPPHYVGGFLQKLDSVLNE